jgi:hypothetical protein
MIFNKLTPTYIAKLDKLASQDKQNNKISMQRPSITFLKQIIITYPNTSNTT